MSKIDWNKPLRFTSARHIANPTVVARADGQRAVIIKYGLARSDNKPYYQAVDPDTGVSLNGGSYSVENVPEEPKDQLLVYKRAAGDWAISTRSPNPTTKSDAEVRNARYTAMTGRPTMAVKVPV